MANKALEPKCCRYTLPEDIVACKLACVHGSSKSGCELLQLGDLGKAGRDGDILIRKDVLSLCSSMQATFSIHDMPGVCFVPPKGSRQCFLGIWSTIRRVSGNQNMQSEKTSQ